MRLLFIFWALCFFSCDFIKTEEKKKKEQAKPMEIVPVHQEPNHHLVFENQHLRVLDLKFEKGDTSQYHLHANDICYLTLDASTMWLDEKNQSARSVELPIQYIGSNITHTDSNMVHRIANVGDDFFRMLAIENLLAKKTTSEEVSFEEVGELIHQNSRFSIQKIEVHNQVLHSLNVPKPAILMIKEAAAFSVIVKGKATILKEPGDFIYVKDAFELMPTALEKSNAYLIQLN